MCLHFSIKRDFPVVTILSLFLLFSLPANTFSASEDQVTVAILKNWPPYYSLDKKTRKPAGFAIEIFEEVSRICGIDFRYVSFDSWPAILQAGVAREVDVVANMGITRERQNLYDFTAPVEVFDIQVFVRKSAGGINRLEDLKGRKTGVVEFNKGLFLMQKWGKTDLEVFPTLEKAFFALLSGNVDALVYPEPIITALAEKAGLGKEIKAVGEPIFEVKRGIAVRKGQPALFEKLNAAVEGFVKTEEYHQIYQKWFSPQKSFWNVRRTLMSMTGVLLLTICGLLAWRYFSIVRINRQLNISMVQKKTAEQKLREQQYFLEKAQEMGQIGTWELDLIENRLYWTKENYKIFGVAQGTVLTYETFMGQVHPEDREYVDQEWKASFDGNPYDIEHRLLIGDEVKWVREKAELAFNEAGECIRGIGFTQDITTRKLVENSLKKSEEKFRLVFHTSLDAINMNRLEDGMYIEVNHGFTQMTGYAPEDVLGRTFHEVSVWNNLEDRDRLVRQLKQDGLVESLEAEFIGKDGQIINGLMSARLLNIYGEEVIVSITKDYTEQKRIQQSLARSEAWHRSIIQTAMDGFWLVDLNGRLLEVNQTYCSMTGYSAEELLEMRIHDLVENEDSGQTSDHIKWIKNTGQGRFESRHRKKDGTVLDVEVSVQYREDGSGQFVVFIKDITERKNWEKGFRQVQKMESIGNLAAGIAHDFNNILFPIMGMSELLLEDLPPESVEFENAREIHAAGKRAGDLVNQILSFSRQYEHKMMPVRFQNVLDDVMKLCRSSIPKNIEIEQQIQKDCGSVWANATQLHQIGMNLITNAFHAVEDKNGQIRVELKEAVIETRRPELDIKPGKYLIFSVADDGNGIAPEIMDKIFEPYFTTKEQGKGTGLGLAVVYGIVREYGGDIQVQSSPGAGTVFRTYLPVLQKATADEPETGFTEAVKGTGRVLVVDDEKSIARLETQILKRLGYQAEMETGSVRALDLFRQQKEDFDLVMTDMAMPEMTGDQFAKELLQIRPDIPVIICTGYSERMNEADAEEIGIKGFLKKPVEIHEMARIVKAVIGHPAGSGKSQ